MRGQVALRAALGLALATASLACVAPPCPGGSHDEMGRCLADVDAAIDAPGLDVGARDAAGLDAPGPDAPGLDASTLPEACVLEDLFEDRDGDGHGDAARPRRDCGVRPGLVRSSDDCDDDASAVHPGAGELCNGADDDCDDGVDEGIQALLGAPRRLDTPDPAPYAIRAVAVGTSYVVAWMSSTRAGFVRRYAADGSPLSEVLAFGYMMRAGFLELVPAGDDGVAILWASTMWSPPEVYVDFYRVAEDPLVNVDTVVFISPTPEDTHLIASATTLTAIYTDTLGVIQHLHAPLPTVVPTTTRALGWSTGVPRSMHSTAAGPLVLEGRPEGLQAALLEPTTLLDRVRATVPDWSLGPADVDAAGGVTVIGAETLRFDVEDLATVPLPVSRAELRTHGPTIGEWVLASSEAGTDLAISASGLPAEGFEWQHLDRTGGTSAWATVMGDQVTLGLAAARLSTRRGAIFLLTADPAIPRVLMQDIGCE